VADGFGAPCATDGLEWDLSFSPNAPKRLESKRSQRTDAMNSQLTNIVSMSLMASAVWLGLSGCTTMGSDAEDLTQMEL